LEATGNVVRHTGSFDPDNVGYTQWQIAVYTSGDVAALENTLMLLDAFFVFKTTSPDFRGESPKIHFHNDTMHTLRNFRHSATYPNYTFNQDASPPDLHVLCAYPPEGVRILKMLIRVLDEQRVSVMWHGATFGFMESLYNSQISGNYFDEVDEAEASGGAREFWLFIYDIDLQVKMDMLKDILADSGFYDTAMIIDIEGNIASEGVVYDWIQSLKNEKHYRLNAC